MTRYAKSFAPLESDPEILTGLMHTLGVAEKFTFRDVLDLEGEAREPALALVVVFPESSSQEREKAENEARRGATSAEHVQFIRQTIDNACGMVAIVHCVLNSPAAESIGMSML